MQALELKKADGNGWVDEEEAWERFAEVITIIDSGSMFTCPLGSELRKKLAFESAAVCTKSLQNWLEALDAEDEWTNFELLEHVEIFHEHLAELRCKRRERPIPRKKPEEEFELDGFLSRMPFLQTVHVYPEMPANPKDLVSTICN